MPMYIRFKDCPRPWTYMTGAVEIELQTLGSLVQRLNHSATRSTYSCNYLIIIWQFPKIEPILLNVYSRAKACVRMHVDLVIPEEITTAIGPKIQKSAVVQYVMQGRVVIAGEMVESFPPAALPHKQELGL